MKNLTLTQIKAMDHKNRSNCIKETIKCSNNHDVYLDKLITGQYLVSYGETPKTIHTSLIDADHWYNITVNK